ncbi:MAG: dihydropteroate synthase [Thermodesulfobacteriota bacterium]
MNSRIEWKLKGGGTVGPAPFLILGILNVTPNSFFDGGRFEKLSHAARQIDVLLKDGADIIDVGGESSRPFSRPVGEREELNRILPVVQQAAVEHPGTFFSVDTYRSGVAKKVLEAGVSVINDISACTFDPGLVDIIAEYKPGYVLMHSKGTPENMQIRPEYDNVLDEIEAFFIRKLNFLTQHGVPEENIVLDPGIGFGKSVKHNLQIIGGLDRFSIFNRPLMIGLSNKSLWGKLLDLPINERNMANQVGTALAAKRGAGIHRVHDVAAARQTLTIVSEIHNSLAGM